MVKKRTKVLVGVAAGVVVLLLLAGALLLQPPMPYDFMRGARFEGVATHQLHVRTVTTTGRSSAPTVFPEKASRSYRTRQSAAEVERSATMELAVNGWSAPVAKPYDDETFWIIHRGADEQIQIIPDESGGCYIHLISRANSLDRIQSRLWRLTHR